MVSSVSLAEPDAIPDPHSLEEKFDPEMRFRPLPTATGWIVAGLLLALSLFHYYTAGFGLLHEGTHRGIHMAFVLGLIFLVFAARRIDREPMPVSAARRPGPAPP